MMNENTTDTKLYLSILCICLTAVLTLLELVAPNPSDLMIVAAIIEFVLWCIAGWRRC